MTFRRAVPTWDRIPILSSRATGLESYPTDMPSVGLGVYGILFGRGEAQDQRDLALPAALADGQTVERREHREDTAHHIAGGLRRDAVLFGEERGQRGAVLRDELRDMRQRH